MQRPAYKTVKELDGIKLGRCQIFNDTEDSFSEVLKIFPKGNNITSKDNPFYVRNSIGALSYYSRNLIKHNI